MVDGLNPEAARPAAVGVVITTYNHAHFLGDAIESVLAQSHPAAEIVVVDDGSTDDPRSVVARYPGVRLVRQANQGLAAARNTGLAEAKTGNKVIFLDADDRLLPNALAAGLACFAGAPESGFVYGGHRRISVNGRPLSENYYNAISAEPYCDFLKGNLVGMHAAVMYDRARLIANGGFDPALPRCEDYDVYLRMSRSGAVASHPVMVAEYRWHGGNTSANHREMLHWSLRVHRRQARHALGKPETAREWRRGRTRWRDMYVGRMLTDAQREWTDGHSVGGTVSAITNAMNSSPSITVRHVLRAARRRLIRVLSPRPSHSQLPAPAVGSVNLGDLDRVVPISLDFGYDRGTPIDRYYIERFLERHSTDIAGRVLEVADAAYSRRFGGSGVTHQDVLNLSASDSATIVGDLCDPQTLPGAAFDCLILTQTLHLIFDMRAAVAQMHRALKAGGVALITVPGISYVDRGDAGPIWCWALTRHSAFRLFAEVFGDRNVQVEAHGNVYAATTYLFGLAIEEVDTAKLDVEDARYPVTVSVRAQKTANGITPAHPSIVQ
jgi:GT2 family glycosyltransferase/SAM-dependent methyltransferase